MSEVEHLEDYLKLREAVSNILPFLYENRTNDYHKALKTLEEAMFLTVDNNYGGDKKSAYHIEFGQHSNIPDCCIKFFLTFESSSLKGERHCRAQARIEKKYRIVWQYRPCVKCMKKRYVQEIHECSSKCKKFLKDLGDRTGYYATYAK